MKCDELKALVFSISDLAYVDEPTSQPNFQNPHDHAVYKATEVDEAIAELKAENERLRKMSSCKFSDDCLRVRQLKRELEDAGMRERRLKRALWLTRALRARDIQRWWIAATCAPVTERACRIWNNIERKSRAKAEQYR